MQFSQLTKDFFLFVLVMVTWIFFDILSSYFSSILWSSVLTVIFYPIKNKLKMLLGCRNEIAVLITIIMICLIVFIPITIIFSSLASELNVVYNKLRYNTHFPEVISWIFTYLPDWFKLFLIEHDLNNAAQIQQKLSEIILKGGKYLAGSVFLIGRGTFGFVIRFAVMLYLLFFFLKEGPFLVKKILKSLPLSNIVKHHLSDKFASVAKATVKGTVIIAAIQGILGGIALYFVDIDGSIVLGALMSFLSIVPIIGLAIVWVPTAIYLLITHHMWKGLFIVAFFVIIVGLTDNFLRPSLVRKDTKIPDYLILITTLGGIELYSINGFIIGPLVAALFISCWDLLSGQNYIGYEDISKNVYEKE